jgi:hypothetical protein
VSSQIDDTLIDSIVAGVLDRLRGPSAPTPAPPSPKTNGSHPPVAAPKQKPARVTSNPVVLSERVITEAILEEKLSGANAVRFSPKAVLTPTARDYLRINDIEWAYSTKAATDRRASGGNGPIAALIVRTTPAVERVLADLLPGARTELLGCPDDAAKLAIGEIVRGGFARAVIFAEQAHRAACLANRHEAVKAVAVRDAADVATIRKQLRANVWCLDPTSRGYFELRNVIRAITKE